jgi:hypothetical protein
VAAARGFREMRNDPRGKPPRACPGGCVPAVGMGRGGIGRGRWLARRPAMGGEARGCGEQAFRESATGPHATVCFTGACRGRHGGEGGVAAGRGFRETRNDPGRVLPGHDLESCARCNSLAPAWSWRRPGRVFGAARPSPSSLRASTSPAKSGRGERGGAARTEEAAENGRFERTRQDPMQQSAPRGPSTRAQVVAGVFSRKRATTLESGARGQVPCNRLRRDATRWDGVVPQVAAGTRYLPVGLSKFAEERVALGQRMIIIFPNDGE